MTLPLLTTVYLTYGAQTATTFNYKMDGTCANPGEYVSDALGAYPVCVQCSPGQYGVTISVPGGTKQACRPCPAGTYLVDPAKVSLSSCTNCNMGHYQESAGASTENSCRECPSGKYGDQVAQISIGDGTGPNGCKSCVAGMYGDEAGQTSNAVACKNCEEGRFQATTAADACDACVAGTYGNQVKQTAAAIETANGCKQCGKGKYSSATAAVSESQCNDCGAGKYGTELGQSSEAGSCIACAVGKANPASGQSLPEKCANCVAGRYQGLLGKATCTACAASKYGDQTGQVTVGTGTGDGCKKCGVGKYNSAAGGE